MKIVIKIVLLVGVIGYLIFGICSLSRDEEKRICSGVEILINDSIYPNFVDVQFIEELLTLTKKPVKDIPLKQIDIKYIEHFIQTNPYIDSAICYYTPENIMCISVFPHKPILHVVSDSGENYYMDKNGNEMPSDRFHLDLCLATGKINKEYAREHLTEMASYINTHTPWNTEIQQLHVKTPKHIEMIPFTGEHVIVLGEPTNIEQKMNKLSIFYKEGLNKAGWNKYSIINLNYDNQIVCTKRNKK